LPRYRACQHMYRHEWKVVYTTSERKLTGEYHTFRIFCRSKPVAEHLVQDETRFAHRPCTVCSCHKRHTEWVDYLSVGGEQGMQNEFLRWIALRGLSTIIKYIFRTFWQLPSIVSVYISSYTMSARINRFQHSKLCIITYNFLHY
jgi:hypothetical protein